MIKALPRLLRLILLLSLLATSGCAWLDARQRQIIYRPTTGMPADFPGLRDGDERYFLPVPPTNPSAAPAISEADRPQRIEVWWLPHADPQAPTLLYLHGTFRNLFDNIHKINALRDCGFRRAGGGLPGLGPQHADHPVRAQHCPRRGLGLG